MAAIGLEEKCVVAISQVIFSYPTNPLVEEFSIRQCSKILKYT